MPNPILSAPDSNNPALVTGGLVVQSGGASQVSNVLQCNDSTGAAQFTVGAGAKNVTIPGTLAVTGASTLTGAVTMSATPAFSGGLAYPTPVVGTADVALTLAQSGTMFVATKGSGNQKFTLPVATSAAASGVWYTFVCGNTATGMTIAMNASDATSVINAKTNAAGTSIVSTAATGTIVNTQGTAVLGDTITLVCDAGGATAIWRMVAQSGIFAKT